MMPGTVGDVSWYMTASDTAKDVVLMRLMKRVLVYVVINPNVQSCGAGGRMPTVRLRPVGNAKAGQFMDDTTMRCLCAAGLDFSSSGPAYLLVHVHAGLLHSMQQRSLLWLH